MAWTHPTLTDAADTLTKFKAFVAGKVGAITGVRTGNGRIVKLAPRPGVVTENWTLVCTVGGATATFSVTGSVSGAQAALTVGTPYSNSFFSCLVLDGSVDFVAADEILFSTTIGGLGAEAWEVISDTADGTGSTFDYINTRNILQTDVSGSVANGALNAFSILDGYSALETWLLTCLTGGPTGTFSVVGSVSGNIGTATVGTPFVTAQLSFTITDGSVDWAVGDTLTVTHEGSTAGGAKRVLVFRSRGLAGTDDNLYHTYSYQYYPSADRWFISVRTHSAHSPLIETYSQANITPGPKRIRLINGSMPAWFIADGRSAKMLIQSDATARQCNYSGFFLPHADASLGEYPFPAFTGGSCESSATGTPAGYAGVDYYAFFTPGWSSSGPIGSAQIAMPSNSWEYVKNYDSGNLRTATHSNLIRLLPWAAEDVTSFSGQAYGDLTKKILLKSIIVSCVTGQKAVLGELEGVQFVAAQSGSVAALDTIHEGGINWLVWNSPKQTGSQFYAAFGLTGDEFV